MISAHGETFSNVTLGVRSFNTRKYTNNTEIIFKLKKKTISNQASDKIPGRNRYSQYQCLVKISSLIKIHEVATHLLD